MRGLLIIFGMPLLLYIAVSIYNSRTVQCNLLGNQDRCPYTEEQIRNFLREEKRKENFSSQGSGMCDYSWQTALDGSRCGKRAKYQ